MLVDRMVSVLTFFAHRLNAVVMSDDFDEFEIADALADAKLLPLGD